MPPNDTPALAQQSSNRKRAASERVVPAIPYALSKPRSSKPKPRPEPETRAVAETVRQEDDLTAVSTLKNEATNGQNAAVEDAVEDIEAAAAESNGVKMATMDTPNSKGSDPMSLSNGDTPEPVIITERPRPATPPIAQEPSLSTTPASSRKPTDRFDMRHIRTELPPAFVPAAEQYTPKSAASSHSNRQPPFHPHAHPQHPNSGGIVFGSRGSSTSSPAPPLSASSAFMPPQYPSFGAMQQPYFAPHGHAHHASEPQAQRMYHPGYQQPPMQWSRPTYQQHTPQTPYFQPHGHAPFRYPPRDIFTPADSQQPNGHSSRSRSISQASSGQPDQLKSAAPLQSPLPQDQSAENTRMMFREPKTAFPGHAHPRQSQFNHQMPPPPPPPQFGHPDPSSEFENAENLRAHVWSSFANPALADCILEISDESNGKQQRIDGHKLILGRSPTLISLIQKTEGSAITAIKLQGQHIRLSTFMDAVKYLYGGPLLQLDHQRPGSSSGEHIPSNVDRMETALQHIATGAWLKVPIIAGRGVEVAGSLLHWDTIANALGFALDGGLSNIWSVDDGSEDRASTSSSDDSLNRAEITGSPTYDPHSTHLLQRIIDFTVHVFPLNFYLDSSAPQLATCPRLPTLHLGHESRPPHSDPRLTQIRFGEIPNDNHQRPSFTTSTISSILLSLPFALLKCVLEHFDLAGRMGSDTVASIMRQVVAERESRRIKALKTRSSSQADDATDPQLVQNLYWEEFVESSPQHRAGFRLARRKRDIDTPPSSGPCSEHNK